METIASKDYPAQFKADAVALYRSRPGTTVAQIADDLDPTTNQEQPDPSRRRRGLRRRSGRV